jgi:exonuclease III
MKIIEWNCNMAFRKKNVEILKYNPDILIVPECENEKKLKFGKLTPVPRDFLWFGQNENKGIGIFSYSDYKLNLIEYSTRFKYVIPIEIRGQTQFNLFAIWAMDSKDHWYERYIAQVWLGINYFDNFLSDSTLLVGDFNSNKIWDSHSRLANHTDVVDYLDSKNIHSLYHLQYRENQGNETKPTLFLHRKFDKPYHIDYCFASDSFIEQGYSFKIGDYNDWIQLSDHVPIMINFGR